jgi:hypothetical protein
VTWIAGAATMAMGAVVIWVIGEIVARPVTL